MLLHILALHLKCLTRRDLLGLLDLLEGGLGLIPCGLRALTSLGELGLLSRRVILQGLTFFNRILELLLDFLDPGLELFSSGFLLDGLPLGFGQSLLQGLHLDCGSCTHFDITISMQRLCFLNTQQDDTILASLEAAL